MTSLRTSSCEAILTVNTDRSFWSRLKRRIKGRRGVIPVTFTALQLKRKSTLLIHVIIREQTKRLAIVWRNI